MDIADKLCALPAIPGVLVHLDETGDFAELTVTASRRLTKAETAACHRAAGELGAGVVFRCAK